MCQAEETSCFHQDRNVQCRKFGSGKFHVVGRNASLMRPPSPERSKRVHCGRERLSRHVNDSRSVYSTSLDLCPCGTEKLGYMHSYQEGTTCHTYRQRPQMPQIGLCTMSSIVTQD
jgi:hypothetical protein